MNNNRIKNVRTPTSNTDVVNNAFCGATYREKSDNTQLLRLGSDNRWDADRRTIYELSRAQYDNEAVTLGQMKDTTDKKTYMNNLLPQILKIRLLIPDYHSSNNNDKDAVNKKYVDSKTFILDVSEGLDKKGNKFIIVAGPSNSTDPSN